MDVRYVHGLDIKTEVEVSGNDPVNVGLCAQSSLSSVFTVQRLNDELADTELIGFGITE